MINETIVPPPAPVPKVTDTDLLVTERFCVSYGRTTVVHDLGLRIAAGEPLREAQPILRRFSFIFVAFIDLNFLLGLILYFGASPVTKMAFQNMKLAMKDHELRFFSVEHTTYMLLAVICAHVGAVLARKGKTDLMKYRGATISFGLSILLILAGIPWWRPLLRLGS